MDTSSDGDILESRIAKYADALERQFMLMAGGDEDRHTAIAYAAFAALRTMDKSPSWHDFLREALNEVLWMQ